MPKQKLFDDASEDEVEIKTENEYAKKYDKWRGKEEIHKLEQKYGTKVLNSDASISSDSEDDSDEPPEVSEEMETQFLKTLALLKKKDPRIYDPEFKFFEEKEKESVNESKEQTLTFADSDDDDDDDDGNIFSIEKKAELDHEPESKVKDSAEAVQDGKLKDYLVGKVDHIDSTAQQDLEPLKALWSDPKLNEGEAFLRDYILNKKYLEEGEQGAGEERLRDDEELGADERTVEEQDQFERKYNFRFEEPDHEYLKRFPRTMNYIRPKDDRRSKKRVEMRSRKEEERSRKMAEIARLKALKLKEIQEKIATIKEVTGNHELAFRDEDIEGEFDPEEHDRRMRAIFDEHYYGCADADKPLFPDLDNQLEIENWDKYEPGREPEAPDFSMEGPHCEDAEFNMDADFDPNSPRRNLMEEMKRSLGSKRRNRKNKSLLATLLSADEHKHRHKYVPSQAGTTYAHYMDEYYKMDCEDVIGGDLPTRFKYREVVPNDYGLTIEEILLADDKELTQWVPLKKIVRHKPESEQKSEINAYAQRAADPSLKRKVLPSLFKDLPEEPELVVSKEENSKKKKKKKTNKQNNSNQEENTANVVAEDIKPNADADSEQSGVTDEVSEKVGKKRKRKDVSTDAVINPIENGSNVTVPTVEVNDTANIKSAKQNKNKEMFNRRVGNIDITTVKGTNTNNNKQNVEGETSDVHIRNIKTSKTNENKQNLNGDSNDVTVNESVEVTQNELSKRQKKNLKKRMKKKGTIVENVTNAKPSENSQNTSVARKRTASGTEQVPMKKQKNNDKEGKKKSFNKEEKNKKPLNKEQINKDVKFKNKNKQNNDRLKNKIKQIIDKKNDTVTDPMSNLSDERLKAYGLNPKKYRSFLKYKKF